MSIFDQIDRTLQGGATPPIGSFDYLNRSARPEAAAVRLILDAMFDRYPVEKQEALKARLRSINETECQSAFFELAPHEIWRRSGCQILAIEPELPGTLRSPDFLVASADCGEFYLEATLATGQSETTAAARRRLDEAVDAIDSVKSPLYSLDVRYDGAPSQPAAQQRLKSSVQAWVDSLDYDEICAAWRKLLDDGNEANFPTLKLEQQGCVFEIQPVPRETPGDQGQRAIGMLGLAVAVMVEPHVAIKGAIQRKASRYGNLGKPYIVAVNSLSEFAGGGSVATALFSHGGAACYRVGDELHWREYRNRDGAWHGPCGAQNTRVSAVLSVGRLSPGNLARRRMQLSFNPWARYPLAANPISADKCWLEGDRLRREEGHSVGEILELGENWPE